MGSNRGGIEPSFDALRALGGRIAGRVRRRRKKEASLESRCVDRAKVRGWLSRKMNGLGFRHWPDRLFIRPPRRLGERRGLVNRRVVWVEFKRLGQEPTPAQAELHTELRRRGQLVFTIDKFDDFLGLLERCQD